MLAVITWWILSIVQLISYQLCHHHWVHCTQRWKIYTGTVASILIVGIYHQNMMLDWFHPCDKSAALLFLAWIGYCGSQRRWLVTSYIGNIFLSSSVGVPMSNPAATPWCLKLITVSSVSSLWNTSLNLDDVFFCTGILYTIPPDQWAWNLDISGRFSSGLCMPWLSFSITYLYSPVVATVTASKNWSLVDANEFYNPLTLHSYVCVLITWKPCHIKHLLSWVSSSNLLLSTSLNIKLLESDHTSSWILLLAWSLGPFVNPHCLNINLLMLLLLV